MLTWSGRIMAAMAVLLLLTGAVADYPELVALGMACLLALLVAGGWMLMRPQVVVIRSIEPARVSEGDRANGVLTLTNEGGHRSPPVLAVERIAGRQVVVPLPSLAGGQQFNTSYPLPTKRRGVFTVGPLTIGHSDPLRLMYAAREFASEATLTVHPRIHDVAPLPTGHSRDVDGPTTSSAPRGGIAFHAITDYQPGDDPRLIHWRSTARLGRLMVRHNVTPNESQQMVVLDTSEEPYDAASFEDAVRVAASLCMAACRAGDPLLVRTTGGVVRMSDRGGRGRDDILDALAAVERTADDPGLSALSQMLPPQDMVSLGVVTGQPAKAQRGAVAAVRSKYQMVSLVQVGEKHGRPAVADSGVFALNVDTSIDFALAWGVTVPR